MALRHKDATAFSTPIACPCCMREVDLKFDWLIGLKSVWEMNQIYKEQEKNTKLFGGREDATI